MRKIAIVLVVLFVGLLFTQFVGVNATTDKVSDRRFAQKVNLALRRTAHHLLTEKGDSTSRIAPVQQLNATTFFVQLDHSFDYGRLPTLLQQSFDVHQIRTNYDVAVLDCSSGELQLGYNFRDVNEHSEVPCGGRVQTAGCYKLQVIFNPAVAEEQKATGWITWVLGAILLGGAYIFWARAGESTGTITQPSDSAAARTEGIIQVGEVAFMLSNQSVTVAGVPYSLTYREAKLLTLFLRHPNQVLERDFILKSVWEDEGIIVGRSVDVFVSRLRKLLQPDSSVRIVAVHGVGYRMEVLAK